METRFSGGSKARLRSGRFLNGLLSDSVAKRLRAWLFHEHQDVLYLALLISRPQVLFLRGSQI